MACIIYVRRAFRSFGKPAESAILPKRIKLPGSAGQDLVDIRLVPYVPENPVLRRIKYFVQGQRQFHHTHIGRQVSAGLRDLIDQEFPDMIRKNLHLLYIHCF